MNDFLRVPLHTLPAEPGCVIDCDTCAVRGDACADCVVSVMLGGPPDVVAPDEQRALGVLAGLGLVPPLLMTPLLMTPPDGSSPPSFPPSPHAASPPGRPGVDPPEGTPGGGAG